MADAPINRNLRDDLMRGIRARRFAAVDLEIGLLLVMGAVVIAMRHVVEERLATSPGSIAAQMAGGLLRALGLTPAGSPARSKPTARPAISSRSAAGPLRTTPLQGCLKCWVALRLS